MDLSIQKISYLDVSDTRVDGIPALKIEIGSVKKMLVNSADVILNYNIDPSYVSMSIHNQNIYVYTQGDTFNDIPIDNASDMYIALTNMIALP